MIETFATDGRSRRLLLVGAGLAGLLAGLLILYSMSERPEPVAIAPPPTTADPPQALLPEPPLVVPEPVPALPAGRNPFSQLVVPAQLTPGDPSTDAAPVATEGGGAPASGSGRPAQEQRAVAPAEEPVAQEPASAQKDPPAPPQDPSLPPEEETAATLDPQPDEPSSPPVAGPAIPAAPSTTPAPPEAPVLLNDALWNRLLDRFQWLHLVAVYDHGAGDTVVSVDVAGRVYTLTVGQAVGPYLVEHIEGRCIEVSAPLGPATRGLLRTCMPPSTGDDLPTITTAVSGECVELRSDLSFPPPPPPALLERRVFLCRNSPDLPAES